MSSSAFTPSTTTVTNNVPVNVPVVEATELYTVTVSQGTLSSQRVFKSRSGDRLIIQGNLVFSAGNASTNTVEISLPSGLTADLSKINTGTGALGGNIGSAGIFDVSAAKMVSLTAWTNSTTFGFSVNGSSENLRGADIGAGDYVNFFVSIPISQWAGSGTTTLATRAVEEYASNSDTTSTVSVTGSGFVNTVEGVVISSLWALGNTYVRRVRFQTAIQPTDAFFVEINDGTRWFNAGQAFPTISQSSNAYGINWTGVSGSSTDIDIYFYKGGFTPSGSTYGANGAAWSGLGYKWRVRKVSSGAQVGYPVSARNIVGDTSGSVVPVGMLGEVVRAASDASTSVAGSNTDKTVTTITLPAGNWLIFGQVYFDPSGTTTTRLQSSISTGTSSLTGTILSILGLDVVEGYATLSGGFINANYNFPANVLATTTYNINVRVTYTGTPSASPLRTVIRAIRIA